MSAAQHRESLRAVVWHDEHAFQACRQQWNRLSGLMPQSSVFLRHEWFDAAWQWARSDSQLYIIAIFEGDSLIGIAPMVSLHRPGSPGHTALSFLTVPDTQMCDIIADPPRRTEVLRRTLAELERRRDWDVLELSHLAPATAKEISSLAVEIGHPVAVLDQGNNPGIGLTGSWSEYYGRRSRRLKKGNNLIANKLRKGGHEFRFQHFSRPDSGQQYDVARLVDEIAEISGRSWKRQVGLSLNFPGPNAFIRRLSDLALAQGWLSIWLLEVDGRALAMEYQLVYDGTIHALRSDFDDSASGLSPGTYLNWKMLEQLFESDHTRYLMGPGDNTYKMRWAEEFHPLNRVVIYASTWRGRWRALLDIRVRPCARWLRGKAQAIKPSHKETQ